MGMGAFFVRTSVDLTLTFCGPGGTGSLTLYASAPLICLEAASCSSSRAILWFIFFLSFTQSASLSRHVCRRTFGLSVIVDALVSDWAQPSWALVGLSLRSVACNFLFNFAFSSCLAASSRSVCRSSLLVLVNR